MQELGYIGQFISGIAFSVTAFIAVLTAIFYRQQQIDADWIDRFRDLYKEFWSEQDMQDARHLINNNEGYKTLEQIFIKRNSMTECDVTWEEYEKLELIDKFCSVLVRVRSFGKSIAMSEIQEEIWGDLLFNFWVQRIRERKEMSIYVTRYWPKLLDPVAVNRKKKYIIL